MTLLFVVHQKDRCSVSGVQSSALIACMLFVFYLLLSAFKLNKSLGTAESFYRPDMGPEELFETLSQTMLAAVDRDCLAGWGGVIHILTPDRHIKRTLKGRHD